MMIETDPFTKLQTKTIKGGFDIEFNADLVKSGERTFLKTQFTRAAVIKREIVPTDTLLFDLEDGAVLKLNPIQVFEPVYMASGDSRYTTYRPEFALVQEQVTAFARSKVSKVRLLWIESQDIRTSEKKCKRFMEAAKCML